MTSESHRPLGHKVTRRHDMAALPCNIVLQGCIQFWDLCVHSHYKLSRYASSACKLSLPWLRDGGWGRSRGARWARAQRRKIPALPSLLAFIQLSSMTLPVYPRIHQQHAHLVRFMCFCEISMIYMIYYSFCLFLNILITNKQLIDKSTKKCKSPPTSANLRQTHLPSRAFDHSTQGFLHVSEPTKP